MNVEIKTKIGNSRVAGIDFGTRRVGIAVCDELQISISPKEVLDYTLPNFWDKLFDLLNRERISIVVVGNPIRNGNLESKLEQSILEFIDKLNIDNKFIIYRQDESMSSLNAMNTMLSNGTKKKARRDKGNTDKIAAAIILKDFLTENIW